MAAETIISSGVLKKSFLKPIIKGYGKGFWQEVPRIEKGKVKGKVRLRFADWEKGKEKDFHQKSRKD